MSRSFALGICLLPILLSSPVFAAGDEPSERVLTINELNDPDLLPYFSRVVIVTLDDETDRRYGPLMKTDLHARQLVELERILNEMHPKVVAYDFNFAGGLGVSAGARAKLIAAFRVASHPIALHLGNQELGIGSLPPSRVAFGHTYGQMEIPAPHPLREIDTASGWANPYDLVTEMDLPLMLNHAPALSLTMVRLGTELSFTVAEKRIIIRKFSKRTFRTLPIQDFLDGKVEREGIRDHYLIIGPGQRFFDAMLDTQKEPFNGVYFHAIAVATLLWSHDHASPLSK